MSKVWDEETLNSLLFSEGIRINISVFAKVLIKSGLTRQFPHVDFLSPEWMLSKMFPRDAIHWVFLQAPAQQVREKV